MSRRPITPPAAGPSLENLSLRRVRQVGAGCPAAPARVCPCPFLSTQGLPAPPWSRDHSCSILGSVVRGWDVRPPSGSKAGAPGMRPAPSSTREVETAPRARRAEVGAEAAGGVLEHGQTGCHLQRLRLQAGDVERRARSAAVACGICMERVYEKALPEERLFGILPNCGHAFCLGCIRQWRRSRDFEASIIKACPECRVTSSYYIPHQYWVSEAEEKEKLIETFKARTGKIRCKFFVRNRGHCPFKSDCIYLHELPAGWTSRHRRRRRQRRLPEFDPFLLESSEEEEEDEELCALEWALTWALMDAESRESTYRLFMDLSDSD